MNQVRISCISVSKTAPNEPNGQWFSSRAEQQTPYPKLLIVCITCKTISSEIFMAKKETVFQQVCLLSIDFGHFGH